MAVSDRDSVSDEMEMAALQRSVSQVEVAIATSTPGTRSFLENALSGIQGRVAALEKKIKEAQTEREAHAREQAAITSSLIEKESALNASEKKEYSGFLAKSFFTKNDFGTLESFYARSWGRLSDSGKDEMSHRIWQGVRRGEYTFTELPENVREKETDWAYATLVKRESSPARTGAIPEKDRSDFIKAYEGGRKEESQEILNRDGFKRTMFRGAESKGVEHIDASQRRETESAKMLDASKATLSANVDGRRSPDKAAIGEANFSTLELSGMKIGDGSPSISAQRIASVQGVGRIER